MELITFDANSVRIHSDLGPTIRFNKSGIITINKIAADALSLKDGDQVKFHQDKKNTKDWYLEKVSANGIPLKQNKKAGCTGLNIQCSSLCKAVLISLKSDKPVKIPVAISISDGKYYALLTSTLK
jgi:hypothetical protein